VRRRPAALTCVGFGTTALAIVLATGGSTSTGCTTHQCDSSTYDYVDGFMEDSTTFVTTAITGPWIQYNGQTTIRIWFPKEVLGWTWKIPQVLVGTEATPNTLADFDDGDVSSPAAGQLAEFNLVTTAPQTGADGGPFYVVNGKEFGGFLQLTNASCAPYFAFVQVEFVAPQATTGPEGGLAEAAPAVADLDAGTGATAEASITDGGSD
jgi:hypothetical protein